MNEYEVTIPGSGTYSVQSDRELSDVEAYNAAVQQAGQMTTGERIQRGIGIGTRAIAPTMIGAEVGGSLAGVPGAIAGSMAVPIGDLLNAAVNTGLGAMDVDYRLQPVSKSIQDLMTSLGVPGAPETQTQSERLASTALETLASTGRSIPAFQALAEVPTRTAGREVSRVMAEAPITQMTVAPVSATSGQFVGEETKSPTLAMLTSLATGAAGGVKTPKRESAPTTERLKEASRAGYETASEMGLLVDQNVLQKAGKKIVDKVSSQIVIDPQVDTEAVAVINRLQKTFDKPQTIDELDLTRQFIRQSSKGDNRSAAFAKAALKEFDDYIDKLKPENVIAGDPKKANEALKVARDAWKRKNKTEVIDDLMLSAELRAGNFSQSGLENAIRRKLISLADSDEMRFFTKSEQDAIIAAAKGGPVQNVLRWMGKLSPKGVVSMGAGSIVGAQLFGPYGAAIGPALGFAAGKGAEALSLKQINELRDIMALGRKPEVVGTATRAMPATTIRGLLNAPQDEQQWRLAQ